jgi:hypothetical protein
MDIRASYEGGEIAEVRGHVGIFEFLDSSHGGTVVLVKGYDKMGSIAQVWAALGHVREGGNAEWIY